MENAFVMFTFKSLTNMEIVHNVILLDVPPVLITHKVIVINVKIGLLTEKIMFVIVQLDYT